MTVGALIEILMDCPVHRDIVILDKNGKPTSDIQVTTQSGRVVGTFDVVIEQDNGMEG